VTAIEGILLTNILTITYVHIGYELTGVMFKSDSTHGGYHINEGKTVCTKKIPRYQCKMYEKSCTLTESVIFIVTRIALCRPIFKLTLELYQRCLLTDTTYLPTYNTVREFCHWCVWVSVKLAAMVPRVVVFSVRYALRQINSLIWSVWCNGSRIILKHINIVD